MRPINAIARLLIFSSLFEFFIGNHLTYYVVRRKFLSMLWPLLTLASRIFFDSNSTDIAALLFGILQRTFVFFFLYFKQLNEFSYLLLTLSTLFPWNFNNIVFSFCVNETNCNAYVRMYKLLTSWRPWSLISNVFFIRSWVSTFYEYENIYICIPIFLLRRLPGMNMEKK